MVPTHFLKLQFHPLRNLPFSAQLQGTGQLVKVFFTENQDLAVLPRLVEREFVRKSLQEGKFRLGEERKPPDGYRNRRIHRM